jgi:outer membrane immunogenic protein
MKCLRKECGWKKLFGIIALFLVALTMYAGPVQAQDEGQKGLSGFYVGALVGYAKGEYSSDMSAEIDHEPSGGLLGVQMGWSRPVGPVILGIDGDIAYTKIEGEDSITLMGYKSDVEHDVNYLGTLRARLGVMAGPMLIYGTAGFAFADLDNRLVVSYYGQRVGSDEASSWHKGWTAGLGVEYPITPNIALGAEYLYVDMGKEEVTMSIGGYPVTDKGDLNLNTFRFGIKYRF